MEDSAFRISLMHPQTLRINMNNNLAQTIGLTTPVSQETTKVKVDTSEHWAEKLTYIPKKGEIVIYSDRRVISGISYPGIKIGDGLAYVVDLPFVGDDSSEMILDILYDHLNNVDNHILPEERELWNNKSSCRIEGERLIFERGGIIG